MNDIQNIITERVDDVPLLLEQMKRMELPMLIDQHFPAHGNWYGLSLGWVSTIWLSSIVSRGDHRLAHVEPWVATNGWPLAQLATSSAPVASVVKPSRSPEAEVTSRMIAWSALYVPSDEPPPGPVPLARLAHWGPMDLQDPQGRLGLLARKAPRVI